MKLHKMYKVLGVLRKLEGLAQEGEGKIKLYDVAFWAGLQRQTTWRLLREMESIGLVTKTIEPRRNTEIHFWHTTEAGKEMLITKEMFS